MPTDENHHVFQTPKNRNAKIWRYMDFIKFLDLLERKAMFFSRVDRLNDPFEGYYPRGNEECGGYVIDGKIFTYQDLIDKGKTTSTKKTFLKVHELTSKTVKWLRQWTCVNCWHLSGFESEAMWKIYADKNRSIAIQSTYEKLHQVLPNKCYVGIVKYIDYDKDWIPNGNILYPFVHKRKAFEYEKEIRAVIPNFPVDKLGRLNTRKRNEEYNGLKIPVDLNELIEKVVISPTEYEWFNDLVVRVIKRYGYVFKVVPSSLSALPSY